MANLDQYFRNLHQLIQRKGFVRMIEAHNGLSALIGETARIKRDGRIVEYDGFWESSLTDSATKGLPDTEVVGNFSRLHTISEILNVTSKPIIVDGDTGGPSMQFECFVQDLERLGVSAVIIEDKVFPKQNSLDIFAKQTLEVPEVFAEKIARGRAARATDDFMVIARIESLIAGLGVEDAFMRAGKYIDAGADGIMIHSRSDDPHNVLVFAEGYDELCEPFGHRPILVCIPTTYNRITDAELAQYGFNVVIHANHLLRSGYKAMIQVAKVILSNDRSFEAESLCTPVQDIFAQVAPDQTLGRISGTRMNRATYEKFAKTYRDLWEELESWQIEERERFADYVGKGSLVLDLGCGPGRDVQLFTDLGLDCVGLDMTTNMLELAQQRRRKFLVQADMRYIPFHDNTFDGIWACVSMIHLRKEQIVGALGEVRRILKNGGIFFVSMQAGLGEEIVMKQLYDNSPMFITYYEFGEFSRILSELGFRLLETDITAPWAGEAEKHKEFITFYARMEK